MSRLLARSARISLWTLWTSPESDKLAERLKKALPPGMQEDEDGNPIPAPPPQPDPAAVASAAKDAASAAKTEAEAEGQKLENIAMRYQLGV